MFEEQTYSSVLSRMKKGVESGIDTREGSVMHNALAPAALELACLYDLLKIILRETYADTASREYLILRAAERGITPNPATYAEIKATITGDNLVVSELINARFACDSVFYTVIEAIEDEENTYRLKCNTVGTVGNISSGFLSNEDYISGVETAQIVSVLVYGEEEEETEAFRARYKESLLSQPFAGNIAAYKELMNSFNIVGGCKIIPAWTSENKNGKVEIIVLSADLNEPTDEEIAELQNAICPNGGDGTGMVPIGHDVIISGAKGKWLIVNLDQTSGILETDSFTSYADIRSSMQTTFDNFASKWEERSGETNVYESWFTSALQTTKGIYGVGGIQLSFIGETPTTSVTLQSDEFIRYEPTVDELRELIKTCTITNGTTTGKLSDVVENNNSLNQLKIKITNDGIGNYSFYPYIDRVARHTKNIKVYPNSNSTNIITFAGTQYAYAPIHKKLNITDIIDQLNNESNFNNGDKIGDSIFSIGLSGKAFSLKTINNTAMGSANAMNFNLTNVHSNYTSAVGTASFWSDYNYRESIPLIIVLTEPYNQINTYSYDRLKTRWDVIYPIIDAYDEEFREKWLNDTAADKETVFDLREFVNYCKSIENFPVLSNEFTMRVCFDTDCSSSGRTLNLTNKTLKLPVNCVPSISYTLMHMNATTDSNYIGGMDWYKNGIDL